MMSNSLNTFLPEMDARDYRKLEKRLKQYIRKRVSHPDIVDDLVQDIFVKAVRTWRDKEAPRNLVAWLFTAARTTIIDHYRKQQLPMSSADVETLALGAADDDLKIELSDCLVPIIHKLDGKYRDALMATDISGQSMAKAAANQNLSLSALKSRVQRGRNKLKSAILQCCAIATGPNDQILSWSARSNCECDNC